MGLFGGNGPKSRPFNSQRAMTASAARVRLKDRGETEAIRERQGNQTWQREAWDYYDEVGEVKYAFGLVANIMSRIRLYAAAVIDPEDIPLPIQQASGLEGEGDFADGGPMEGKTPISPKLALDALKYMQQLTASQGSSTMMRALALNLSVPGECYLVCIDKKWSIRSTEEVKVTADGRLELRPSHSSTAIMPRVLPKTTPIGRIWRPHGRHSADADSSMRAIRSDCEELLLLSRMIRTTTRSRMNAGILFVPDSMSVSAKTITDDPDIEAEEGDDAFEQELMDAMTSPITDETSASSVVPLLIRGPAEQGAQIKYISVGREADQYLVARADKVLERVLVGIDVPKEAVSGLANVKYSNAIVIDESMYKAHIEPMALMVVDALTQIYLRPLLRAAGYDAEVVENVTVWYDPSEVVTRPDRGADANVGYSNFSLSGDAWRDAHGFSDTDAPEDAELLQRYLMEKAILPPEVISLLVKKVFPELLAPPTTGAPEDALLPPDLQAALADTSMPTDTSALDDPSADPTNDTASPTSSPAPAATPPDDSIAPGGTPAPVPALV